MRAGVIILPLADEVNTQTGNRYRYVVLISRHDRGEMWRLCVIVIYVR